MKQLKKILALTVAALLALMLLAGCSSSAPEAGKDQKVYKIGILQQLEHPALDSSREGFIDGLAAAGYIDGENITIDYQNAQGGQDNCVTIANKFVNDKCDMILAIATNAAQAVAGVTDSIPVLITAVTDPAASQIVESNDAPGGNVTGTSDLTPCAEQIKLLKRILPDAKKVAMLYCSSESNSKVQIDLAKKAADEIGLEYVDATVSTANDIQQVVESLAGKVDAIYAPTDNVIANGMPTVTAVATPLGLPVICGEEGMLQNGGLATYGINYYNLGLLTATQAVDIFENGADPATRPIQYLSDCTLALNEEAAAALGITFSQDLLDEAAAAAQD